MIKKIIFALFASFFLPSIASAGADKYEFDKSHTHIIFLVSHLGFSNMIGRIKDYDGYFTFDEKEPEKSAVDVTLKTASVDTDVPALNKELYGEHFFNVEKFPDIRFKSTKITVTGKNTGDITGDVTMLGVTRPVVLHVTYNKSGIHPYTNNYTSGFTADAVVKRSDFGMNAFAPPVVGDDVKLHLEVEGVDPLKHPGNSKTPH